MKKGQKLRQVWDRLPLGGAIGALGVVVESLYLIGAGAVWGGECLLVKRQLALAGAFLLFCAALIGRSFARELLRRR